MTNGDAAEAVVIIGAGQAGVTVATSLREGGWTAPISIVGSEAGAPYQRPGLSKGYLAGAESDDDLILRAPQFLSDEGIEFRGDVAATDLDRDSRTVLLETGEVLEFGILILATGSQARTLPIPGAELPGVRTLRTKDDSRALREHISRRGPLVIVGGGFLGLEAAATATQAGCAVTVLERGLGLLRRAVGPAAAGHLARLHESRGVRILFDIGVAEFVGDDVLRSVVLTDGTSMGAGTVLVAVGASPNTLLAERAGLEVTDGIVVDEHLRTSDPRIFAIGDCARFPSAHAEAVVRLESVQNAVDHARHVAAVLIGRHVSNYASVPWFWSHQYDRNLQIAGMSSPSDREIVLTPTKDTGLAVARQRGGRVVAVETINDPRIHMKARRLLATGPVDISRLDELAPIASVPSANAAITI